MPKDFHKAYVAYFSLTQGSHIINTTESIKKTLTRDYWSSLRIAMSPDPSSSSSLLYIIIGAGAGGLALVLAIVICCCCCCRKKGDEDETTD